MPGRVAVEGRPSASKPGKRNRLLEILQTLLLWMIWLTPRRTTPKGVVRRCPYRDGELDKKIEVGIDDGRPTGR